MPLKYRFYSKPAYFDYLIKRAASSGSGDRIALASMTLDPMEPHVHRLMEELSSAATRGASVNLIVDAYTFLSAGQTLRPGPLFWRNSLRGQFSRRFEPHIRCLEKLKAAGGNYTITNRPPRPFTLPFVGRSHMKFAVVNNQVLVGGCNLDATTHKDLMVGWQNPADAKWLYGLSAKITRTPYIRTALNSKDVGRRLPDDSLLMLDSGIRRQSLIYQKTLALIDQSEEYVFLSCQYHPNSTTLKHLAAALRRGVKVSVMYNNSFKRGLIRGGLHQTVILRERLRMPAPLFDGQLPRSQPYLHAKLLVTDKGSIIGSHNLIPAGVNFGTAEIALLNKDVSFGRRAMECLMSQ